MAVAALSFPCAVAADGLSGCTWSMVGMVVCVLYGWLIMVTALFVNADDLAAERFQAHSWWPPCSG